MCLTSSSLSFISSRLKPRNNLRSRGNPQLVHCSLARKYWLTAVSSIVSEPFSRSRTPSLAFMYGSLTRCHQRPWDWPDQQRLAKRPLLRHFHEVLDAADALTAAYLISEAKPGHQGLGSYRSRSSGSPHFR